ncbi:MAG: glycosyltransferase [Deltaproteobacteria bacterium]|nr:glycosyltransferase [Deltaproteobacteria bacterium]MBW1977315.1 glycosyltransferase [Deltaproteobacteria bacterium]MBW2046221.1 glycosyltransferase [Deltaproteobacteria bacterium]MBW2300193.1 glycosyltransferase [Deltaproteobacteria bacterium]RLB32526.1 MAG: hypothetical protein DRH11_11385 [Deltaproteobacteria bacterium]
MKIFRRAQGMVSIVIPFYERLEYLRRCLDSLKACCNDFDEIIVADDGSSEVTVMQLKELIGNYPFPVKYVSQPRYGFRVAAARNNGVRYAQGEYLIFLDSDFLVFPDTIKQHLSLAKPKRFVAAHCKYLTEEQTRIFFRSNVSSRLIENLYKESSNREIIKQHRRFIKRTILMRLHLAGPDKQSLGGHFSIYRKDFEYINGYDENFVGWGGEDEDLGIRLIKAGIYGRSAILHARALHLWHPRELGDKHWKEGPNIRYFKRKDVPFFCENGLKKSVAAGTST